MGKIAIVFSGQGAQYSGMGKSLYECSPAAKKLYDRAELIRPGTKEQSFSGSDEELKITKNTQPCLYLVDICAALALREAGIHADGTAGFSLGEAAALAYAGAYSPEQGFEAVCHRAEFMQNAAEKHNTSMTAVLKLDSDTIEKTCAEFDNIYPVNYNSPAQTVVSGLSDNMPAFKEKIKALGGRTIDLAVSAAFHSPYMAEASDNFKEYLSGISFCAPQIPVYANRTAMPYPENIPDMLAEQIKNPVLWCKTVTNMINDGFTDFIEAGAGKTLSSLIKKISSDVRVYSVEDEPSLIATIEAVKNNA